MTKILFLHPNFPAQFKAPCISLAKEEEHDILFLCQTHYGRHITGIKKLVLKGRGSHDRTLQSSKSEHGRILYRSEAYRDAFISLKLKGWCPEVVISHCGWGCGMYVKDVWPECQLIAYLEWWFNPLSDLQKRLQKNPYFRLSESSNIKLTIRNLPTSHEMAMADFVVSPTEWQRQQLPRHLRSRCQLVRDEVDVNIFFPEPNRQSQIPVLTYGTRGMEPMRGFPEFVKSLPRVLKKWPQLNVEIAGTDNINYGGATPLAGSWKRWALKLLKKHNLSNRVTWKGRLPLHNYASWLKSSWCHVYLSEPFVTSWSLVEACHCAVPMVASRSPATDEFSHLNPFLVEVDHTNENQLIEAINDRIRFSSNFPRNEPSTPHELQAKSMIFSHMTLAMFIADLEAATID